MTKRRYVLAWAAVTAKGIYPKSVREYESEVAIWIGFAKDIDPCEPKRVRITVVEPKPKRRGKGKNKETKR